MTPTQEKKHLMRILKHLEKPPNSALNAKLFLPIAWIACVATFVVAFQLGHRYGDVAFAMAFVLLGICIGVAGVVRECARQEPVMRGHIDQQSIARRLAELEA